MVSTEPAAAQVVGMEAGDGAEVDHGLRLLRREARGASLSSSD